MTFEYQEVRTCTASIDIDDIGNCCLLTRNMLGEERYLYIKTDFGSTQMLRYGPIVPDVDQLPAYVDYEYTRFDTNEVKIIKTIQKFIADAEYVEVTDIDTIKENMRDLLESMVEY